VNLALPALVILLGLLPGIACFYGYFAGRFDKRTAGVSGVEEVALYIALAIPIDVGALSACEHFGLPFHFGVATHLLLGNVPDPSVHAEIATYFQQFTVTSAWTYIVLLGASFLIGSLGRRFVWACRLDTRVPHLRLKHGWFYFLQGRMPGLPRVVLSYVDVLTKLPDKDGSQTRLFRGLVVDFEIAGSGALESLTLKDAVRGSGRGEAFKWVPIPSTRLLLMGSNIHSINITYIIFDKPKGPSGIRQHCRVWWRSFLFEEP
jgi:hypothetical protein